MLVRERRYTYPGSTPRREPRRGDLDRSSVGDRERGAKPDAVPEVLFESAPRLMDAAPACGRRLGRLP
jgi:hypothetical protein